MKTYRSNPPAKLPHIGLEPINHLIWTKPSEDKIETGEVNEADHPIYQDRDTTCRIITLLENLIMSMDHTSEALG